MRFTRRRVIVGFAALGLGAGAAMLTRADFGDGPQPASALTGAAAPGGPFSLVDHSGRAVTDRDYRGEFMLVFFGYTMCPDICPSTLLDITTIMETLGDAAVRVQPLFISVDPERDTPNVLANYLSSFDPRIIGLTGTPEEIRRAAAAYKVYYDKFARDGNDYTIDHSAYIYFVGPDGEYLTHFSHRATPASIAKDIRNAINRNNLSGKQKRSLLSNGPSNTASPCLEHHDRIYACAYKDAWGGRGYDQQAGSFRRHGDQLCASVAIRFQT